jgi:hypothetical protein
VCRFRRWARAAPPAPETPQRRVELRSAPGIANEPPRLSLRRLEQPPLPVFVAVGLTPHELDPRKGARLLDNLRIVVGDEVPDPTDQARVELEIQIGFVTTKPQQMIVLGHIAHQAAEHRKRANSLDQSDPRSGSSRLTLSTQCAVELAPNEANVPPDAQARQSAFACVLQDRLRRDAPEKFTDLPRGQQWLLQRSRFRDHRPSSRRALESGKEVQPAMSGGARAASR